MNALLRHALYAATALAVIAALGRPPAALAQDAPALVVGSTVYVTGTGPEGLRVHQAPDVNSPQLGTLAEGTAVQVVAGPASDEGLPWYQVSGGGLAAPGWVDGQALAVSPPAAPAAGAATPTDTAPPVGATVAAGSAAWVEGTQGVGLRVHTAPSLSSDVVASLPDGTPVQVVEGPTGADGYEWYRVSGPGVIGSGWAAGQFLSAAPPASFAAFAGSWTRHGFSLTVQPGGQVTAVWRIYRWCHDDPTSPCDRLQGNLIIPGGQATLELTSAQGQTAQGEVVASNVPAEWPTGQGVVLSLQPYNMAQLDRGGATVELCGPQFAVQAPADVIARGPCGA